MSHRVPQVRALKDGQRRYVSRHIYILGASLTNLVLGIYLTQEKRGWRRGLRRAGSVLVLLSPILLVLAFVSEPGLGMAGRSARSALGWFTLLGGVLLHLIARWSSAAGRRGN